MKVNKSKILDINFDGDHLHFDIRVSVPQHTMTGELIKDVIGLKRQFIEGNFTQNADAFIKTWVSFDVDKDNEITFSISKESVKLQ